MSQSDGRLTEEEIRKICKKPESPTKEFAFLHTTIRVKDIKKSLWFYNNVLGMTLIKSMDFPQGKFSAYFLAYESKEDIPKDSKEATFWAFSRKCALELCYNWGSENDPNFKYDIGNGLAHLSFHVPDVYAACKRFDELGAEFKKRPEEGTMKGLAFLKDPDGYIVDVYSRDTVALFA